jgi:hypothetical protein
MELKSSLNYLVERCKYGTRRERPIVHFWTSQHTTSEKNCCCRFNCGLQFSNVTWRRKIFVFLGHPDEFNPVGRGEAFEHFSNQLFWGRGPSSDANNTLKVICELFGGVCSDNMLTTCICCETCKGGRV